MYKFLKTGLIVFLTVGIIFSMASVAKAVSVTSIRGPKADATVQRVETRLDNQHTRADQEIDRRVTALNNLIARINAMAKITDSQKAAFAAQVQAVIGPLQSLKTKIDADTDPATLTADKKTIISDYRIFVFMIPKITIITHANRILDLASLLQAKNPSTDAAAKINDAITLANGAVSSVSALDPTGWPGNKATMVAARQSLKTALSDLKDAWKLMKV